MSEPGLFQFLPQALGAFCLRDARSRKVIAEAAGINPSMLSGYCSGRITPSLDPLDRLLRVLGLDLEDLADEMRVASEQGQRSILPHKVAPEEVPAFEASLRRALRDFEARIVAELHAGEPKKKPARSKVAPAGREPGE